MNERKKKIRTKLKYTTIVQLIINPPPSLTSRARRMERMLCTNKMVGICVEFFLPSFWI